MQNYSVISKGAYVRPQIENFVSVTSFLFIRQDGKKYLLLKLKNSRAEAVEEVSLKVTLLDKKGQTVGVLRLTSDKCGASSFAFGEKIEVDDACCDFIAKVESAVYGGYLYRAGKGGVAIDYEASRGASFDIDAVKSAMHGKTRAVTDKRLGIPVAVSVLAFLLLVCSALVTYFQLKQFMDDATGFTYSGVEYVFTDPDKKAGTDIIVTGYRGTSPNVVIPEAIGGYNVSEIRESAFEGNTKIKRLKIEGDVKIGGYAFASCEKLVSVSLTDTAEVGEYAFFDCTALKTLEISGGEEITFADYAFKNCTALESIEIKQQAVYPENLELFPGADGVKELYLQNYGADAVSALFGGSTPTSLERLTVNYLDGICDGFCAGMTWLESVNINYVEGEEYSIGNYAFFNTALKTLKIPQGLTSIGSYAFKGAQFNSFNAYGVESIGEFAFSECDKLNSFAVPESLTVLDDSTFAGCTSLERVTFEGGNLTEVGRCAFYNCESLTAIEIPSCVENIGEAVFGGCENLISLTLPFIGRSADLSGTMDYLFGGINAGVESVTLTSAVTLAPQAFYGYTAVEEVNLNEGLEYIGDYAFYGCVRLKSIVIPSTVSGAGYDVFSSCYRLYELYNLGSAQIDCEYALGVYSSAEQSLPKEESNGFTFAYTDGAFSQPEGWYLIGYPEWQYLSLPEDFSRASSYSVIDYLFYNETFIIRAVLPEAVGRLGKYAFCGCSSLTDVTLPRSVTEIESYTFYNCSSLERAQIDGAINGVGDHAFSRCSSLAEISIPSSSVRVGDYAFSNCSVLTSVNVNGVTSIGEYAFYQDTALKDVQILTARGSIGYYAFYGCSALSELVLPNGTSRIEYGAFCYCINLRKIILPASLTAIESYAFENCYKLRAVANLSSLAIARDDNFGGVGSIAVYITTTANGAGNLYYTEAGGITFLKYYNAMTAVWCDDNVTEVNLSSVTGYSSLSIADMAFYGNRNIKSADLRGVSEIGENAFWYCTSLTGVKLNSALKVIGNGAFAYCTCLETVNLQDTGLNTLGEEAFYYCRALKSISLPNSLTAIPERAFTSCEALSDAVIPQSVRSVGNGAFFGCTSLLQVHNLSPITMLAGSTEYGYCSYYALCVFTDADSKMYFAEKNGYQFAGYYGSWYLYGYSNYEVYKNLPESFTYGNTAVNSYVIRSGAFSSAYYLIIPTSVSNIEDGAISSVKAVYYCGTPLQWSAVRPASTGSTLVYFYSQCIHTDGGNAWTYDGNYPSTGRTQLDWTVTKQATCTENGVETGKCPYCGYTETEVIEKLYHSADADGNCTRCGEHGEFVESTDGSHASYTVTASGFTYEEGMFSSTNSAGTYATVTLTAKEDMQVFFGCAVSSYYDEFTVTAGGVQIASVNSTYFREFSVSLSKGQSLTFSFYTYPFSFSSGRGMISYILIFA